MCSDYIPFRVGRLVGEDFFWLRLRLQRVTRGTGEERGGRSDNLCATINPCCSAFVQFLGHYREGWAGGFAGSFATHLSYPPCWRGHAFFFELHRYSQPKKRKKKLSNADRRPPRHKMTTWRSRPPPPPPLLHRRIRKNGPLAVFYIFSAYERSLFLALAQKVRIYFYASGTEFGLR